eukprot:GHVS01038001.1.p1 GENE.GHVS01038001.1~~GHVS01038001.1.p1  ORF type:complete len:285 (-),score=24.87 GHVS01038001.1:711-1565(-)
MFLALATTGHTAMMSMGRSTKMICWIRRTVEQCDSLQSFFLIHSLGGGTGSGLGTYALELLEDNYPEVFRFVTAVFPSADDDVITSPYNSCLAISKLRAHASCVFPVANDALMNACRQKCNTQVARKKNAFDDMNEIVANLLINLTSSMRFEGSLNVDLNEITTNLVPFPQLHFILSAMSPLRRTDDIGLCSQRFHQVFNEVLSPNYQLFPANPKNSLCLASAFLVRGDATISSITRNIERAKSKMKLLRFNKDGFKVGLCRVPPINQVRLLHTVDTVSCACLV